MANDSEAKVQDFKEKDSMEDSFVQNHALSQEGGVSSSQTSETESRVHNLQASHPLLSGKYTILDRLGHGAQGTVLKAQDESGKLVAIKVFDLSDPYKTTDWKAVELLRREVDTLKNLDIEGIPKFIEYIEGTPCSYLVESYIDAKSIQDQLDDGVRLKEGQIWIILQKALEILKQLHGQLQPIIHRDLKPGNILVDMDADHFRVWIVDFGTVTAARQKTQASTVAGTFGYAAPEQFYGHADPSSDIYGLGMTLIHALTGVAPCRMELDGLTLKYEKYFPVNASNEIKEILSGMVKTNPKERFQSVSDVMKKMPVLEISKINGEKAQETSSGTKKDDKEGALETKDGIKVDIKKSTGIDRFLKILFIVFCIFMCLFAFARGGAFGIYLGFAMIVTGVILVGGESFKKL